MEIKELIVAAIMGELANRSISFIGDKCWQRMAPSPTTPTEEEDREERLRRLLLRLRAVVEDAEGRHITSQAMLLQLDVLKEMYRGYYTLDTVRCRAHRRARHGRESVDHSSFALISRFNSAKRFCIDGGGDEDGRVLRRVLASLEAAVKDAPVFVVLSGRCAPRLLRQPYSMHLLLDNFMFGRQMEMEHVVNFLLESAPLAGDQRRRLGVLPIVGPGKVGKSTLVEHVCMDERVRAHFSKIVCLGRGDLRHAETSKLADGSQRILIVVELDGHVDEGSWQALHSAAEPRVAPGSKIVVTSRSDKIAGFGTAPPLRLQFLTEEAFWYLLKVRTFGSTDTREHPELTSLAMAMASEMNRCFMSANIFGAVVKTSLTAAFWRLALATYRDLKVKNQFLYGAQSVDPWKVPGPIHVPTPSKSSSSSSAAYNLVVLDNYETTSSPAHRGLVAAAAHADEAEAPEMTVQDVMFGSAAPQGKFRAVAWRSHIPPHYNYVFNCEIVQTPQLPSR